MSQDDIVQIKIGAHSVGITGFFDVMAAMAGQDLQKPDAEIMTELLNRLSKKNYIPNKIQGAGIVKKLSVKSQKLLKGFQIFLTGMWVGGAVALTFLNFARKAGEEASF